jgi:arylformamidase
MYIDLTHTISAEMTYFPGTPPPVLKKFCTIEQDGYTELELSITTHTGTHIDAPAHILKHGRRLEEYEISYFIGKAVSIDCTSCKSITKELLEDNRILSDGVNFLILKTGWAKRWGSDEYLRNFPALTQKAAEYIVSLGLRAVCMDTISADRIEDISLPIHNTLLGGGVLIAENLNIPEDFPCDNPVDLWIIPLKIANSDGSTIRVFAR